MPRAKLIVPHKPIHITRFLLLAFLCYEGHQLMRHLTGAALCGGFGTMTFTVAATREPCSLPTLLTLSGPVFTYGLAWLGMFLLRPRRHALIGYALIFASFAPLRAIQSLTGRGDELVLAEQWFGITSRAVVAAVVLLIALPPVLAAYRAIGNRQRGLVLASSWLLPLPVLFVLLVGNSLLFERGPDLLQEGAVLGIYPVVLVSDLLAAALFFLLKRREAGTEPEMP